MKIHDHKIVAFLSPTMRAAGVQAVAVFFVVTGTGMKYKFFSVNNARLMEFTPFFEGKEFYMPSHIATRLDDCDEAVAQEAYQYAAELERREQEEKRRIEEVVLQMKKEGKI